MFYACFIMPIFYFQKHRKDKGQQGDRDAG